MFKKTFVLVIRSIAAVLAGYLLLAVFNMAFVMLMFMNPGLKLGQGIVTVLTIPYTIVLSGVAGYLSALIAGRSETVHVVVLAVIMGAVIVFSMFLDVAVEPLWYKTAYLICMIPATVIGGYIRSRHSKNKRLDPKAEPLED